MYSKYNTPNKQYLLKTDDFVCNKFGLAEFFANNYENFGNIQGINVIDVGCGVLPLGIFLAEQKKCKVTGIDLNPIACRCAEDNADKLKLNDSVKIITENFAVFTENYKGDKFDLIVANPPVDDKITNDVILKYANNKFQELDNKSFSYLTNSWHSVEGKCLIDYIFEFGQKNLKLNGRIIIVFCTVDCTSPNYVYEKSKKYDYYISKTIEDFISSESIGVESLGTDKIDTFMVEFRRI